MPTRRVNIIWMPEEGGCVRQFRIPLWPFYLAVVVALLVLTALTGAAVTFFHARDAQRENRLLFAENEALRGELVALGAETDRLDCTVRAHIQLANEARLLAGLPPYGEEAALLGVGGTPVPEEQAAGRMTPPLQRTVRRYHDRLDQLGRQLAFQEESFVEVREVIAASRERLDHVPTINPVAAPHYFSSGFGARRDPFTGRPARHNGIDLSAPRGTPFRCTADGQVVFVGRNGDFGKSIKIDHGNGFVTVYAHADRLLVERGQAVRRGDVIGEIGNTGRSTGDHLHYEVRQDGRPVNPRTFIIEHDNFLD